MKAGTQRQSVMQTSSDGTKKEPFFGELGAGMNTPAIVKFSFWCMVHEWPDAIYACINLNEAYAPKGMYGPDSGYTEKLPCSGRTENNR